MSYNGVTDPALTAKLLNRPHRPVYGDGVKEIVAGRPVLVTGAGGSIGGELVRQLIALGAGAVCFVDNDEAALYNLQLGLSGSGLLSDPRIMLASVADQFEMDWIFGVMKPAIVFHAAAHKHLPLLERAPRAAIRTNVLGTDTIAAMCVKHGAELLVNISTDKAANPTSVLGMSKRLAEMLAASHVGEGRTRIASVRFGNVLGSRGSFLQTLAAQIASGQKVEITHPDVTRYFMTIPQAAGLVLATVALDGDGMTYVLDMGSPIRIEDLVKRYVTLTSATRPTIEYTGLRPGEKLDEELFDLTERRLPTTHPDISRVRVGNTPTMAGEIRALFDMLTHEVSPEDLIGQMRVLITDGARNSLADDILV